MRKFAADFLKAVEQADTIVLFRHLHPDMDAQGSQLGLKAWLQHAYPEKKVYAAGNEGILTDCVEDAQIENALAIVTDTATAERVDDDRFLKAKEIIRIDHHVRVEDLGNLDYVDDKAAAACELIALILKEIDADVSADAAQWLMKGLMTDSQRFSISSVRSQTFEAAAYLSEKGANVMEAKKELYAVSIASFDYAAKVRSKACRSGRLLFSVMGRNDYLSLGVSNSDAREHVNDLSDVVDTYVWALITENAADGNYCASLRSHTVAVRDIAAKYGGGGHEFASGIKNITADQVIELLEDLKARANA